MEERIMNTEQKQKLAGLLSQQHVVVVSTRAEE